MADLLRQVDIANLLGVSKQRAHQLAQHVTSPPSVQQHGGGAFAEVRRLEVVQAASGRGLGVGSEMPPTWSTADVSATTYTPPAPTGTDSPHLIEPGCLSDKWRNARLQWGRPSYAS